MKHGKTVGIIITVACAAMLLTIWAFMTFSVEGVYRIGMDVEVKDRGAFNLQNDSLHFGGGPPGIEIGRSMKISNTKPYPISVELLTQGNFSSWIVVDAANFTLSPYEYRDVNFNLTVPENATYGKYIGELIVTIKRA